MQSLTLKAIAVAASCLLASGAAMAEALASIAFPWRTFR